MLHENTRQFIMSMTDAQLVEYIEQGPQALQPEPLAFARAELNRRGIVPEQLQALKESAQSNLTVQAAETLEAAQTPLGDSAQVWAFIGGMFAASLLPILPFFIAWGSMRQRGEDRKIRDMWSSALGGFVTFHITILVIVGAFALAAWLFDLPW